MKQRLTLRQWMENNGCSNTQLGDLLGVAPSMVSKWRNGLDIPRRETMRRIYEVTKGQVEPSAFYDLPKVA